MRAEGRREREGRKNRPTSSKRGLGGWRIENKSGVSLEIERENKEG